MNQFQDLFNITPGVLDNLTANQVVQTDANSELISLAVNLASSNVSGILPTANSEAKIKTVTGTTGRIVITGTSTDPIFNIDTGYLGQTSITTLGTITSGTWNSTVIGGLYINYNTTNLRVLSNQLNTIQDISTGSQPQFARVTVNGIDTISSTFALAIGDTFCNSILIARTGITTGIYGGLTLPSLTASSFLILDSGKLVTTTTNVVTTITGTSNQVISSASTGAITLSLPQSIATTSSPTFFRILSGSVDTVGSSVLSLGDTNCNTVNISRAGTPTGIFGGLTLPSLTASSFLRLDSGKLVTTTTNVVTTLTGTTNQVNISASTGAITLSLPQSIATTSSPTFNIVTVNTLNSSGSILSLVPDNSTPFGPNDVIKFGFASTTSTMRGNYHFTDQLAGSVLTLNTTSDLTPYKLTDGQVLIGASGANGAAANLTGTSNQVNIANAANSITLSLPQSIATSSNVQFGSVGTGSAPLGPIDIQSSFTATASRKNLLHIGGILTTTQANSASFLMEGIFTIPASSGTIGLGIHQWLYPNWNIGTSSTLTTAAGLFIDSGGNSGAGTLTNVYSLYCVNPAVGTNKYAAYFGGRVGINISNPSKDLELGADSAQKPSTNTWTVTSDERIKKNINNIDSKYALNIINQLKIKKFDYIDAYKNDCKLTCMQKIGVIAQDIEKVLPCCVSVTAQDVTFGKTDDNQGIIINKLKSVNMDQANYLLISAVQELSKQINELKAKLLS